MGEALKSNKTLTELNLDGLEFIFIIKLSNHLHSIHDPKSKQITILEMLVQFH